MSLQVKLSSSSLQSNTLLNSNSSIHFDFVKTFILNDGQVRRGDDEYYLVLYERFSTMAEVKQVLRRHGIDTLSGNFDQLYRFYQAFEAGSRTMFICDSASDLREPVILNCSSISRISPENVNEGGKYGFRVEVDGRIFQFHTNTKEELLSWIKAFKKPLPKNRKIKAQTAEEEEEYLGSEVEFDCASVHAPTDLAAYYRFGSPPSMKKWKKGIAKPFKMVFKAVKKGIIDHNAIAHNKRPKHKALPKIGSGQSKHVFAPRLPMLVNWGENLWILTERYQLWLLGLESGQWLKNFPKKPPQRFKCLTVCNECLFGLTLRGELWCLQLTKKYKLRQDHPEAHEWISDWPQKAPTAFQVIYGQKNKLFGLTETGVLWGCSVPRGKWIMNWPGDTSHRFKSFVENFITERAAQSKLYTIDFEGVIWALDIIQRQWSRIGARDMTPMLMQTLCCSSKRTEFFSVQETEEGGTAIYSSPLTHIHWTKIANMPPCLLVHITLTKVHEEWYLVGTDSFNTLYARPLGSKTQEWVKDWISPMPEKSSAFNNESSWEQVPGPPSDLIQISVGDQGTVMGVRKAQDTWKKSNGGPVRISRWKPTENSFVGVTVGSKSNTWAIDAIGHVYRQIKENVWERDADAEMYSCVCVGGDGILWAVDKDGYLWKREELEWVLVSDVPKVSSLKRLKAMAKSKSLILEKTVSKWKIPKHPLNMIAAGDAHHVWGIAVNGQVYQYNPLNGWKIISGILLSHISVGNNGAVWGVDRFMDVYRLGADNRFISTGGKLRKVHISAEGNIWGVGCDGSIWKRKLENDDSYDNTEFSYNALLCANMSSIVYDTEESINVRAPNLGCVIYRHLKSQIANLDAIGFIGYNEKTRTIILAFRGTSTMKDAFTDINLAMIDFYIEESSDIKVHRGFLNYYTALRQQIMDVIDLLILQMGGVKAVEHILITGHSLGGAMATLASVDMANHFTRKYGAQGFNYIQCLTFGAPPVGNMEFRKHWMSFHSIMTGYHFQDPKDDICHGDLSFLHKSALNMFTLGYRHVTSIVRLKAGNGHRMCNYINLLQELLPGHFATEFPLLMRIQIKTAKNSESPWYHFEGTGANGIVKLTIGDFRPNSRHVRQYPLDSVLGRSFGRGKTDTFFVGVAGLFRRSQLRNFILSYEKKGYGTSRWAIDEVKIELDQEVIYHQQKLKAILDETSNKFEAEFQVRDNSI